MADLISKVRVYGLEESIEASKYPMAVDVEKCTDEVTPRVKALGNCATGTAHDQFLTGIIVQFNLNFTCNTLHPVTNSLVNQLLHSRLTVKHGILRVNM